MKQYEEVFFSIVRHALWKAPLEIPEGFSDWGSVMKLAKSQAMTGLVGDVLLRTPDILETLPPRFVARLQEIPLENMGTHTVLNNTLIMVVTRLREHGIEPVLLKGQGIAQYYPVPQLRQCGDIDLYVGEENYAKAYDVLLPVATEIDDRECIWESVKHFHLNVGPVLIEVHRYADVNASARLDRIFQRYAAEGLKHDLVAVDFTGVHVNTPADGFNAYYIFNHLWHHFLSSGVGMRQFCDLACFLNSHELDESYMKKLLVEMKQLDAWQAIGEFMVEMMGLDRAKVPCFASLGRHKAKVILDRILQEGNFGKSSSFGRKRDKSYFVEKTLSLVWHIRRHLIIFTAFPVHALRQMFFTIDVGFRQVFKDLSVRSRR